MSKKNVNKIAKEIFIFTALLFILLLTAINISSFLEPKKVLGIETEVVSSDTDAKFWNEFLTQHPKYIPGWIELGRMDKVKEIDPNYITP